jgi:hypothetical protein
MSRFATDLFLLAKDRQILAFHAGLTFTPGIWQSPPSEQDNDIAKVVTLLPQK